jgi:hypothetical protein
MPNKSKEKRKPESNICLRSNGLKKSNLTRRLTDKGSFLTERNLELINHNAAERELRGIQQEVEKNRDQELLNAALAKEKALQEIEEAERAERRREVVEL